MKHPMYYVYYIGLVIRWNNGLCDLSHGVAVDYYQSLLSKKATCLLNRRRVAFVFSTDSNM